MKMNSKNFFLLVAIGFLSIACNSDDDDYTDVPIAFEKPSNFPEVMYDLNGYPLSKAGVELGKKLFYDGRLSSDGIISCGFCHIQDDAFTHHGHTFSHGVGEGIGTRNAPPVQNMAFQNNFMWDGATDDLNALSLIPISSPIEMDGNLNTIVAMLNSDAQYKSMFARAFPNKPIDTEHMLKALGQFMVTMVSSNSKFDKYRRNETGGTLSQTELEGYAIFNQKCASCHGPNGEGQPNIEGYGYAYPPLWGEHSYNVSAGLFRLSNMAGYVYANMPFNQAMPGNPKLTVEEAWDVSAYVNSMPRPQKKFQGDWPNISKKPFDHPFGPYTDGFSEQQHKLGPFKPILAARGK